MGNAAVGLCGANPHESSHPLNDLTNIARTLTEARGWHALKYNSRPPHTLHFAGSGLETSVRQSAMPLLWPLPQFQTIINQLDLEIFYDNRAADPDPSR